MTADNPNLFFDNGNDFIAHKIKQARLKAERDHEEATAARRKTEKEARELLASAYEDSAEIAFGGIEIGLDKNACLQIAAALKLQAALIRGDVNE